MRLNKLFKKASELSAEMKEFTRLYAEANELVDQELILMRNARKMWEFAESNNNNDMRDRARRLAEESEKLFAKAQQLYTQADQLLGINVRRSEVK